MGLEAYGMHQYKERVESSRARGVFLEQNEAMEETRQGVKRLYLPDL
jgi:hypothetical protein